MQFKKPKFWDKNRQTIFSLILFPLSIIVYFVAKLKRLKKGKKFKFPIICIGNVYLGGTGKTPISIEIFKILSSINKKPVFIKKFYPYIHDEINILNKIGPVISEKSRINSLKSIDNTKRLISTTDIVNEYNQFTRSKSAVGSLVIDSISLYHNFCETSKNESKNNWLGLLSKGPESNCIHIK